MPLFRSLVTLPCIYMTYMYLKQTKTNVQDLRLNSKPDVGEVGSCVMVSSPPSKPNDSSRSIAVPPPSGDSKLPWGKRKRGGGGGGGGVKDK